MKRIRMPVILLVVGIMVAAAGVVSIGFGIPIRDLPLGAPLLIGGATALTGGLIMVGLSVVATEVGRLADGMRTKPSPRPTARTAEAAEPVAQPAVVAAEIGPTDPALQSTRPAPAGAPLPARPKPELPLREPVPYEAYGASPSPSSVDVSAAAIERLRSSIPRAERLNTRGEPSVVADVDAAPLSPNGTAQPVDPRAAGDDAAAIEPKVANEDRLTDSAVDALKASRLDFLFRTRARPGPPPRVENFDAVWPADGPQAGQTPTREPPKPDQVQRQPMSAARAAERPTDEQSRKSAILKSGVVDGMAYTLYSDGSIEAKLPQGTVRFGSIAELRAHIESNS